MCVYTVYSQLSVGGLYTIALEVIKCSDSSREILSLATVLECAITKSEFVFALEVGRLLVLLTH